MHIWFLCQQRRERSKENEGMDVEKENIWFLGNFDVEHAYRKMRSIPFIYVE